MPINSKAKGKKGEAEAKHLLNKLFGANTRRTQQYSGAGKVGDVEGIKGVHIEVKRRKVLNVYGAVDQAVGDAPDGDIPLVLFRKDSKPHHPVPWLAIVRLDDLPALAVLLHDLLEGNPQEFDLLSSQDRT